MVNFKTYCVIIVEESRVDIDGVTDTPTVGAGMGGITMGAVEAPKYCKLGPWVTVAEFVESYASLGGIFGFYKT